MEAREYLEQVPRLDLYITQTQNKINKLKRMATSTTAQMDGERVSSSTNPQKMADTVIGYVDIERQELTRFKFEKAEILETIQKIRGWARFMVLYEHYFNGKSLKRISTERQYSYSHVVRLKREGLAELQEILDK